MNLFIENFGIINTIIVFISVIFLGTILILLVQKTQSISILKSELLHLNATIQDLDQQAKLIIKSDMELQLYQQKIEDELNKLSLIKNMITSSINILDREKLFLQINEKVINDIGFKKGLILNFDELDAIVNINFEPHQIQSLKTILKYKKGFIKRLQFLSSDSDLYKELINVLQCKDILVAPIEIRGLTYAIFIISDLLVPTEIKKSEQKSFLIICMYLSRCLDNIGLFEELERGKTLAEKKVKEKTHELLKSLRKIETISKLKTDFISSVSHELRTPLTSVKGFSSLLVMGKFGELNPEVKKRLEKIDLNVNKLVTMVNMLLDIARIESGKTEVKIASADIVKLILDVTELLYPQMENKKIKLSTTLPEKVLVLMDKNLIERVLINLINNSLKFTPECGKIMLQCAEQKDKVIVSVSDTGVGISQDDLVKVFTEFYRTATTAGMPGTGLGLSLVKKIIDIHKEKIWVNSELGKGTSFSFTLKIDKNE